LSTVIECQLASGTFVREAFPATRYYTAAKPSFWVSSLASTHFYSYLNFNLPAGLAGKRVISAIFECDTEARAGTPTLRMQRHSKPTTGYAELTWNNHPVSLAGAPSFDVTQSGALTHWTFDLTSDIQAVALGDAYYGYVLVTTNVAAQWRIMGYGTATPPKLTITLDDAPLPPTDIEPNGAVGLAKPVFNWTADPSMISAQIQITTPADTTFAAPVFDSGAHSTVVGQLDTNALGYGGITANTSVLVRIRQTNGVATSAWSDAITVTYTPLGTLSTSSPSGTTTDPTPTVAWAFTGTQARWQVTTYRNGVMIEDTGVVPGTDTSHQPAVGAVTAGQVLSYRIRVWDNVTRLSSVGDPAYRETTITTTYNPGAVTPLTTLDVTQDGQAPWVDLEWTRTAGVADLWVITRDGEIIDRILGTSGGSPVWSYKDWACPPNRDVVYRVFPQTGVNPATVGSTGPTVTIRTEVDGAWVYDPATDKSFSISGHNLSAVYGESSVVYSTVGGIRRQKRTWALRGLEGNISGLLDDFDGRTVEDQLEDLYAIKGRADVDVRLVFADKNIPVSLDNLSPVPSVDWSTTDQIRHDVSFDFNQTGELPFPEVSL
jgi:hypothetical protein